MSDTGQDAVEAAVEEERHVLDEPDAAGRSIRGGGVRLAGFAVGAALALAAAPLLTRHLGVAGFGDYVVVTSVIGVVANFSDAGLVALGIREYAVRSPESRRRMLGNLLGIRLLVTAIGVLAAIVFAAFSYGETLIAGTALAGIGLLLMALQHTYTVPLSAELRLGRVTALDLGRQALVVAGIVAVIALDGGLLLLLAIPIPIGVVIMVATAVFLRGTVGLRPRLDRAEWRYLAREALPYAASTAAGALYYKLAVILLSLSSAAVETGLFSVSLRVIEALLPIPGILASAVFPIFARAAEGDRPRLRQALQRTFDTSIILGTGLAVVLALSAGVAIAVLGGEQFSEAAPVLRLQAVSLAATFVLAAVSNALLALRMQVLLTAANALGVVIVGVLTLVLAPASGAMGAATAMVLAEFVLLALYAAILVLHHRDLVPSLGTLPLALGAAACALPAALLPVPEVLQAVVGSVVYLGVLALLRAYPPELLDAVRPLLGRLRRR